MIKLAPIYQYRTSASDADSGKIAWRWVDCDVDTFHCHDSSNRRVLYPAPPIQNNEIRDLVNRLRDVAVAYHGTQQLRARISRVVISALSYGE